MDKQDEIAVVSGGVSDGLAGGVELAPFRASSLHSAPENVES